MHNIACAIMYLNRLHKEEYREEFAAAYDLEQKLRNSEKTTFDNGIEVRKAMTVMNSIIKYNKNHFKNEEGYL